MEDLVKYMIDDDKEAFAQEFTAQFNTKLADALEDEKIATANIYYNELGVEDDE